MIYMSKAQNKFTTLTSVRMPNNLHDTFKHTVTTNNLSISKCLETLVRLYISDYELQNRVRRGAHLT